MEMNWQKCLHEAMEFIDRAMDDKNLSDEDYNKLSNIHSEIGYILYEEQ